MRQRARFLQDLEKLKANTTSALDAKKLKALLLRSSLKEMAIRDLIQKHKSNSDFLDSFRINTVDGRNRGQV